ncbi:hypothetical protein [Nostoc sp.]|uniref:hypothetical protein n=1 Tax=Nostoc sp. TaxID=1180 RepID=UPI002FF6C849
MQPQKDIGELYKIRQRILSCTYDNDKDQARANRAFVGITQAIEELEKLEDSMLDNAIFCPNLINS